MTRPAFSSTLAETAPCHVGALWHNNHTVFFDYVFQRNKNHSQVHRDASVSLAGHPYFKIKPTKYGAYYLFRVGKPHDFIRHGKTWCDYKNGDTSDFAADSGANLLSLGISNITKKPLVPNEVVAWADAQAIENVEVDIAEDLATMSQTLSLAGNLVTSGIRLLMSFRRRSLGKSLDEIAKIWLTYQYGIKPLVSDIIQIVDSIKEPVWGFVRTRGTAHRKYDFKEYENISNWAYCKIDGDYTVGCNSEIGYRVWSPEFAQLASWGLLDPFSLAWNLTPFSFVADWFLNIGDILRAIRPHVGLELLWSARTLWWKSNYTAEWCDFTPGVWGGTPKKEVGHGRSFDRDVTTTWLIPPVVVNLDLNFTQLANAIALLRLHL